MDNSGQLMADTLKAIFIELRTKTIDLEYTESRYKEEQELRAKADEHVKKLLQLDWDRSQQAKKEAEQFSKITLDLSEQIANLQSRIDAFQIADDNLSKANEQLVEENNKYRMEIRRLTNKMRRNGLKIS